MNEPTAAGEAPRSLKARAIDEGRKFAIITAYMWVLCMVFSLNRMITLDELHIHAVSQALVIVNALVLAKVALLAEALDLGRHGRRWPMIWSVLWHAVLLALVLLVFHVIEDVAKGLLRGHSMAQSMDEIGGGKPRSLLAMGAITAVAMVPFCAFQEVSRLVGSDTLRELFFARGTPAGYRLRLERIADNTPQD